MREAGPPPPFESDRQKDVLVATFLSHHFLGPEDWAWLRPLAVEDLSDEVARALVFVRETSAIDNAAYRHINQVHVLNASQHLRCLRDYGLLEQPAGTPAMPLFRGQAHDLWEPGTLTKRSGYAIWEPPCVAL